MRSPDGVARQRGRPSEARRDPDDPMTHCAHAVGHARERRIGRGPARCWPLPPRASQRVAIRFACAGPGGPETANPARVPRAKARALSPMAKRSTLKPSIDRAVALVIDALDTRAALQRGRGRRRHLRSSARLVALGGRSSGFPTEGNSPRAPLRMTSPAHARPDVCEAQRGLLETALGLTWQPGVDPCRW